jgi:hypothetical protein
VGVPVPPVTLLIDHVAVAVMSTGLPPEIVALAVKFAVPPLNVALAVVGLIVIPVTLDSATVMVEVPLTVPEAPVIVEVPGETPVTRPELLTVATLVSELLQNTSLSVEELPSL